MVESIDRSQRRALIEHHVYEILKLIGDNPDRDGLKDTPARVGRAYINELMSGYESTDKEIDKLITKFGSEKYNQMIICKDIEFYSMCEHHILPFYGRCHVGYIPGESLLGISKIPRVVEAYSRRLQIQERLTNEIANCIENKTQCKGVIVIMEAVHLCMRMRGVRQQNSVMMTSAIKGIFLEEPHAKQEFIDLINRKVEF